MSTNSIAPKTLWQQYTEVESCILEAMTGNAVYSEENADAELTRLRELWALLLLEEK